MSLVFAGVTPHPPMLLPSIGKEKTELLSKTKEAFTQLEEDLYIAKPQLIVVISPHTGRYESSFCINANARLCSTFEEFGDLSTKKEWMGATDMAAHLAHQARETSIPLRLISEEKIDHGASVPLHFLTNNLSAIRVLPVGYSNLDAKAHIGFGEMLKDAIMQSDKRIAVIASGDLSHCHKTDGPAGFHKAAQQFDETLITMLQTRNTIGIAQMDGTVIADAKECAYRSVLILLGILKNMDYSFHNYSYEAPFGVGYLVGNFSF